MAGRRNGPEIRDRIGKAVATMEKKKTVSCRESESAAFTGGHELDSFLGKVFDEGPIWTELLESIRDTLFPPKLPLLELTSRPIAVVDRMAVKANPWAIGISMGVNIAILSILVFLGVRSIVKAGSAPKLDMTKVDITDFEAPKLNDVMAGGGGSPDKIEAIKGKIPPRMQSPEVTPKIEVPALTINVQKNIVLPDNSTLPNFGMSSSPNVTMASRGNGAGIGVGNGNGSGYGNGTGGNVGGGVYQVGVGISPPVQLNQVEVLYSDEARRAKYQGICVIRMIVDALGNPQDPQVVRPLGMGLDEKALEAVRKYRFKPAMKGNTPIAVQVYVQVDFRML